MKAGHTYHKKNRVSSDVLKYQGCFSFEKSGVKVAVIL